MFKMGSLIPGLGQSNPLFGMGFAEGEGSGGGEGAGQGGEGAGAGGGGGEGSGEFNWKGQLGTDLSNSPTMKLIPDTKEGLTKAITDYGELEKLLGHDKVPMPKGDDDVEGWNRLNKAMGVPDRAEAYGLPDAEIPESMKDLTFDKGKFAQVMHQFKLTPNQAKGMWEAYTNMSKEAYGNAGKAHEAKMTEVINQMKGEYGDAYESKIELGQLVINKFSGDQETQDYITSTLSKDARGIKFLAKVGGQFAENKIGEFKHTNFSLTPETAQNEIDKIMNDPTHPYTNPKATEAERNRAIDYVNGLYAATGRGKG